MSQRSLDWWRKLKKDPPPDDLSYAELIREAAAQDDWYSAYMWSKGWVGNGGATAPDPWLGYAISALLNGQPRNAVNSIDLALRRWIVDPTDRAILHWARATVVDLKLADPKTALADYQAAEANAPDWLAPDASEARRSCIEAAARSRRRKPTVEPAPDYDPTDGPSVEPRDPELTAGEEPRLMQTFRAVLGA